jgi:hypothetical protein
MRKGEGGTRKGRQASPQAGRRGDKEYKVGRMKKEGGELRREVGGRFEKK